MRIAFTFSHLQPAALAKTGWQWCIIHLHQKLLAITDAGGGMLVGGKTQMGGILVRWFDENHLGQLIRRRVHQILFQIIERAKMVVQ